MYYQMTMPIPIIKGINSSRSCSNILRGINDTKCMYLDSSNKEYRLLSFLRSVLKASILV